MIPEHIRSTIDSTDAEAWAVDGFGSAHPIGATSLVGRNHECDLVVLTSSVSREHAELEHNDTGWTVRDLGSRNGTFIDGVRVQGRVALPPRAKLAVGDVALWFLAEVVSEPPRRPLRTTGEAGGGLVRYQLLHRDTELCIVVGSDDVAAAGAVLSRARGSETWSERGLAPLEFQLLRVLCIRAHEEAGSPLAARGCIPTKQLVRELPFQSKYANEENVRQVVLRLRSALSDVGAAGVLAVAPGRGYYLACGVAAGPTVTDRR